MTVAFNYPEGDTSGGRVVLTTCHPEDPVMTPEAIKNSYIKHAPDGPGNNLWDGLELRYTKDDQLLDESDLDYNATNWYVRREVAWAAGNLSGNKDHVPDTYLPPVYGKSQVVDITKELQEQPEFTVQCCVGKNNNEIWTTKNLSLYYRYKGIYSGYNWTNWTRYSSIYDVPYRFTFNANNAYGSGKYEFCSILRTTTHWQANGSDYLTYDNESFPPAADTYCYVGEDIVSDFSHDPGTPYVDETVHFYGEACTKENTYITTYLWDFGDSRGPGPGPENTTHRFTHPGVYTVNLTVVNNQSKRATALVNITVINNVPHADFTCAPRIAHVNQQINFTDTSTDIDGTIVNRTWDFGDNTTSYLQNPTHHYTTSDLYTVSLTVTDDAHATNTMTKPQYILIFNDCVNSSLPVDQPSQHTWKTIQKAIDNASTNDFIYIHNGTYTEDITVNKSLTLIGEHENGVLINGSITMMNPFDYELTRPNDNYTIPVISMNGTELLMHFNNDSTIGEHYTTSPVVYDYSGQKHNGTLQGATWSMRTLKGTGCFDFDGSDDSIDLPAIRALTNENVTVSAWVNWDNHSEVLNTVLSQRNTNQKGYGLFVNGTTAKPGFQLNETTLISSQTLTPGWHHLVGKHNATVLSLYVDGVLTGSMNKTGVGTNTFGFIGCDGAKNYFTGRIDEVAVWNRTLSNDEIASIYWENNGVYLQGCTIKNTADIGISPCNHSEVSSCTLLNNPTGILVHNIKDVRINQCNISNGTTGINVNSSSPEEYNAIRVVDCYINNVSHAMYVNSSANISVIGTLVYGRMTNLTFDDCDFPSMTIYCTTSVNNTAPDVPSLSGPSHGDRGTTYTYTTCTNDSNDDQLLYFFDWGDGNNSGWLGPYWSNTQVNASHAWSSEGGYYVKVKAKDIFMNESAWNSILFRTELLPPLITNVQHSPDTSGFGGTISIEANVTDDQTGNWSGIRNVKVNITLPDNTTENFSMVCIGGDVYQYNFSDTWLTGEYDFTVWAQDNAYNNASSSGYHFHVSADATISIATLKDSYSGNEFINITDPSNSSENLTVVSRGLTWNTYYNASTGENTLEAFQGPVNYQDENDTWMPINNTLEQLTTDHPAYPYGYRFGNNRGLFGVYFKPNVKSDWPVAFTYNRTDDTTTCVIRSKLVGVGYVDPQSNWAYEYLQNVQSSSGQTNDNSITYPGIFTGTDVTWSYGNTGVKEEIILSNVTKTVLQNHPPSQYGLNDASSYLVFITRLDYQNLDMYNASGKLTGNVTISDKGVDFRDALGYFKCALPLGDAYELNNESVQQKLTYRIVHVNGETYLLSGLKLSDLTVMTFPVVIDPSLTLYSISNDGYIYNSGTNYNTVQAASSGTVNSAGTYIMIGQRKQIGIPSSTYYVYRGFVFFNTSVLPANAYLDNATLSVYKKDDYSTTDFLLTIQNGQPNYPHNPLQAGDYNKNYYSGSSDTLNTSQFTNGYNAISLKNLSWISTTGITKLCVRSSRDISGNTPTGNEYVNVYASEQGSGYQPKLVIMYRNQSKIKNTGSTDIKGYLLMQVQFYNASQGTWVLDNGFLNESSPRTINSGKQLGLDTVFNGNIRASDLQHGTGTYCIFTALRDSDGNILRTNDGKELAAWWLFNKT